MQRYVEIEQTRLARTAVNWQVSAVHPRTRVPSCCCSDLENAVRYGAERVAGVCEIDVKVRQRGFVLEIGVSNPLAREPVQREGNQIGLNNIRGRLALIYDLEARLETRVRRGRFELTMTIRWNTRRPDMLNVLIVDDEPLARSRLTSNWPNAPASSR